IHTLDRTINVFARMLENITFREDVLKEHLKSGFLEATDIAEYLVTQGVPFREAHEIVGNLVKYCEVTKKYFPDITKDDLETLGIGYGLEDLSQFTVENCVKNRNSFGGTGFGDVDRQISNAKKFLEEIRK
ncbi:MAG: argininosuccinate lyase, partial [Firmicutes bacterium]|nr:argininosuccinate lyase [Bacillota bacterium]